MGETERRVESIFMVGEAGGVLGGRRDSRTMGRDVQERYERMCERVDVRGGEVCGRRGISVEIRRGGGRRSVIAAVIDVKGEPS